MKNTKYPVIAARKLGKMAAEPGVIADALTSNWHSATGTYPLLEAQKLDDNHSWCKLIQVFALIAAIVTLIIGLKNPLMNFIANELHQPSDSAAVFSMSNDSMCMLGISLTAIIAVAGCQFYKLALLHSTEAKNVVDFYQSLRIFQELFTPTPQSVTKNQIMRIGERLSSQVPAHEITYAPEYVLKSPKDQIAAALAILGLSGTKSEHQLQIAYAKMRTAVLLCGITLNKTVLRMPRTELIVCTDRPEKIPA